MNWQHKPRFCNWLLLAAVGFFAGATTLTAQVKSQTSVKTGAASQQTDVEHGEAVYVSGNNLLVRMETGELRHFVVPDNVTVTVDGKELTIHDLKPGMKLQRTITTTRTPRTITTVKTVTGTVWKVMPPHSVILILQDGTKQRFEIPSGQKFLINGQETDAFGLKKNMRVSASAVTEVPQVVVAREVKRTGKMPPLPPPPPEDTALLIEQTPAPVPSQVAESAPTELPKTGGNTSLLGLLSVSALIISLILRMLRGRVGIIHGRVGIIHPDERNYSNSVTACCNSQSRADRNAVCCKRSGLARRCSLPTLRKNDGGDFGSFAGMRFHN